MCQHHSVSSQHLKPVKSIKPLHGRTEIGQLAWPGGLVAGEDLGDAGPIVDPSFSLHINLSPPLSQPFNASQSAGK